jgi:hypothetical protein
VRTTRTTEPLQPNGVAGRVFIKVTGCQGSVIGSGRGVGSDQLPGRDPEVGLSRLLLLVLGVTCWLRGTDH